LLSALAFENMNDHRIQRLQMACAIWGEKCNLNIFQSNGISWVCSTLVNEQQIFLWFVPVWRFNCTRNSSKVAEVVHELEFAVYLVGSFFLSSGVFCTWQLPVEVIYWCH